jgi:adenylate kinase
VLWAQFYRETKMSLPRRQLLVGYLVRSLYAQALPKRIILMLGPPGSGKTTQSDRLRLALGLPVISMPDILKSERAEKGGPNRNSKPPSDEMSNSLLRKRVSQKDCERGFILDGYPLTAKQAQYFDSTLKELGLPRPVIIHLSLTDYEGDQRLAKRGRVEDSPASTELRIVMYRKQAELLMPLYPDAITLDASQPADVVAANIRRALGY